MIFVIVCLALLVVFLAGFVVVREVRLYRRPRVERPATLEGGGSHLTGRKG